MTSNGPDLFQTYVNTLRAHAHWLIAEGYARMDNAAFASEEEPAITGELVREMRAYLEAGDGAPAWVCYYSIHDDPPLSVSGKLGKTRPRVDIEFERAARGPRPRLRFEAKRLDSTTGHTVSGYLGRDGLGCFLSGRYPMTHGEAGMLGYVQSEDETTWVERMVSALSRGREGLAVMDPLLSHQRVHPALHHTYCSRHRRNKDEAPVVIHHVLLRFGGSAGRASHEQTGVPPQIEPGRRHPSLHLTPDSARRGCIGVMGDAALCVISDYPPRTHRDGGCNVDRSTLNVESPTNP